MKQLFRIVFVAILYLHLAGSVHAQSMALAARAKVDSLVALLSKTDQDTNAVNLLNKISDSYGYLSPDSGVAYGLRALELAKKLSYRKGIAWANAYIGENYANSAMGFYYKPTVRNTKSHYILAWDYHTAAEKIFEEIGDKRGLVYSADGLSSLYFNKGDNEKALEYDLKVLKFYTELGERKSVMLVTGVIGDAYKKQKKYARSLEYYFKAITMAKELNEQNRIAGFIRNIGDVYVDSGDYPVATAYYDNAYRVALQLPDQFNGKMFASICLMNIADVYTTMKEYRLAIDYAEKSLAIKKELGEDKQSASELYTIGDSYLALVKAGGSNELLNRAITYLRKGLEYALELNSVGVVKDCLASLAEAYRLKGAHKPAMEYYQQYVMTRDSIDTKEEDRKIQKQQMQYEFDKALALSNAEQSKKDAVAEEQLQKEKNIRYASVGMAVLLLGIAVIAMVAYRQKQRDNVTISKEKQLNEDLLLNILPSEIADELKANGSSKAKQFNDVTVLFTDFVGFTKAGERMTPGELVAELDNCFKAFDGIMSRYGIEKIKTIGDAYLAVSGLPKANPDHAEVVVAAAIDILRFMKARREELGDKTFEIRIGVNSGNVVAGIVGVKKFAYDIWGDTVNTAARMEQNSQPGRVNISETTYQLVKERFACTYRGEIAAKNKGELKMYFVDGVV